MKSCILLSFYHVLFIITRCSAQIPNLDLYITKEEGQRIVGTPAEIYYIRNGVKSDYSLLFAPTVLHHIRNVSFCWSMNGQSSPELKYTLNVRPASAESMDPVTYSIPTTGLIPVDKREFTISLPCNGKKSEETMVIIEITISGAKVDYSLDIKRKRMCKATTQTAILQPPLPASNRYTIEDEILGSFDPKKTNSKVKLEWIIVLCVVSGVLIVFFSGICIAVCRPKKKALVDANLSVNRELNVPIVPPSNHEDDQPETDACESRFATESLLGPPFYNSTAEAQESLAEGRSYDVNHYTYETSRGTSIIFPGHPPSLLSQYVAQRDLPAKHREIDMSLVEEGVPIATGNFGLIKRGSLTNPDNEDETMDVLIKSVKNGCSQLHANALLMQGMLLYGMDDIHVNGAIGFVTSVPEPMIIYRSAHSECLKDVLNSPRARSFSLIELIGMGVQALEGLLFIHSHGVVHRDIAARNCLLTQNCVLQITDDALAKDLHPNDYLCLGDNENRPVKWMAYESLMMNEFSTASDVWSFGVLMWELFSLGQTPFEGVDGFDMAINLRDGYRLGKPCDTCPGDFWTYLSRCWFLPPDLRPTVDELTKYISGFHRNLANHYV